MPSGTHINVFAARLHKSNAASRLEDIQDTLRGLEDRLLLLAGASPRDVVDCEGNPVEWIDHIRFEVRRDLEELRELSVTAFLAKQIVDFPEYCNDELEYAETVVDPWEASE